MDQFNVYKDMKARTNGEIYIGVVGPVRTGKSTFIKRFMNLMVGLDRLLSCTTTTQQLIRVRWGAIQTG